MLVKMKGDGQTYNGHYKDGDVLDLSQSVAMALISQGRATDAKPTKKNLETLENREGRVLQVPSVGRTAAERDLSLSARTIQTAREPNELLTSMRADASNEIEDDTETGALTKSFEQHQERIAAEYDSDEEPNVVDLNKQAREAALQDRKDAAEQNKSTAQAPKPAESKPTTPARAPRT